MPDDTQNDRIELTRRKLLGGTGTIGIAGLGAGPGTTALFSDGAHEQWYGQLGYGASP